MWTFCECCSHHEAIIIINRQRSLSLFTPLLPSSDHKWFKLLLTTWWLHSPDFYSLTITTFFFCLQISPCGAPPKSVTLFKAAVVRCRLHSVLGASVCRLRVPSCRLVGLRPLWRTHPPMHIRLNYWQSLQDHYYYHRLFRPVYLYLRVLRPHWLRGLRLQTEDLTRKPVPQTKSPTRVFQANGHDGLDLLRVHVGHNTILHHQHDRLKTEIPDATHLGTVPFLDNVRS